MNVFLISFLFLHCFSGLGSEREVHETLTEASKQVVNLSRMVAQLITHNQRDINTATNLHSFYVQIEKKSTTCAHNSDIKIQVTNRAHIHDHKYTT